MICLLHMHEQLVVSGPDRSREQSAVRVEAELRTVRGNYYQLLNQVLHLPDNQPVEGVLADQIIELKARASTMMTTGKDWLGSSAEPVIWRLLYDVLGADAVEGYAREVGLRVRVSSRN